MSRYGEDDWDEPRRRVLAHVKAVRMQRAADRLRRDERARQMAEYEATAAPIRARLQREYTEQEVAEARRQAERRTREAGERQQRHARMMEESRRIAEHLATMPRKPMEVQQLAIAVCRVAKIDTSVILGLLGEAYQHGVADGIHGATSRISGTAVTITSPYTQAAWVVRS